MATLTAASYDSTTQFLDCSHASSSVATEGEATYWPSLRGIASDADRGVASEAIETTSWRGPWENRGVTTTEHRAESPSREVTPLVRLPGRGTPPRRFQVLRQLEGVVTRIDGEWFEADLRDLTAPNEPLEIAEFPFAEISPADRPLIRPGCVFYWVIGYETRSGGQITNSSEIRVRRAPQWTLRKLEALKVQARELFTLEGEDGETATRPK